MNQHKLHVPTLKANWFRELMQFLDGTCGNVTLGAMRDHIGREVDLTALDFMITCNNAFHAGILREDSKGVTHFEVDVLDTIVGRANAENNPEYVTVDCVKPDCKD